MNRDLLEKPFTPDQIKRRQGTNGPERSTRPRSRRSSELLRADAAGLRATYDVVPLERLHFGPEVARPDSFLSGDREVGNIPSDQLINYSRPHCKWAITREVKTEPLPRPAFPFVLPGSCSRELIARALKALTPTGAKRAHGRRQTLTCVVPRVLRTFGFLAQCSGKTGATTTSSAATS
jgi:hypothetical protein